MKKNLIITVFIIILVAILFVYRNYIPYTRPDNIIETGNIVYVETFDEFQNVISSKRTNIVVFGKKNCPHCQKYLLTLRNVIESNALTFYYVDLDYIMPEEKNKILTSDIIIPGSCNQNAIDQNLRDGFGTPLTLFIHQNDTITCLRGNVPESEIITKVRELQI